MSIKDVNQANFDEVVLRSTLPVLVDFNAEWCPPCQALHPILAELSDEVDSFEIVSVDIDESPELAEQFDVSSIPCLVAFKDGAEFERMVGLKPKAKIVKMMEKA